MKLKFLSITSVLLLMVCLIQGCYISKPLDREVHVFVQPDFPVNIVNTGNSMFSSKHSEEEYRKSFMDALIAELKLNHVIADGSSPEFNVIITSLDLHESTKMDTVKNVKSQDNGRVRELTQAGLKSSGKVVRISTGGSGTWNADKSKDEEVTNNRSLGQMIEGVNKDNSVYREKIFDDNEFMNLCALMGRRSAVRIEKEIQSQLK